MWYIFDSEQEAKAYDSAVCAVSNFQEGVNWGNPRKHPTLSKWAIKCSPRVVLEGQTPVELTGDWFEA